MEGATSGSASASASSAKGLACTICGVKFEGIEEQKGHMKSEWHIYNLKRNIANLSPLSSTIFQERVKARQIQDITTNEDTSFFKTCPICDKEFYKEKAWKAHVGKSKCSKKLESELGSKMENLALNDVEENEEESDQDEDADSSEDEDEKDLTDAFDSKVCLFCLDTSASLEANVIHMQKTHGLFIPSQEYLIDTSSLLSYLHIVINEFCECLSCEKQFLRGGGEAVRMHMIGKGHCKFDVGEELEAFWDFNDEDEEEEEGDGEPSTATEGKEKTNPIILTPETDNTIRLPSGKVLGHRSNSHIYRQNKSRYEGTPEERLEKRRLAIEEFKSAKEGATTSKNRDASGEEHSGSEDPEPSEATKDSKERVEKAISTLVNSRVRGVNKGQVAKRATDQTSLIGLSETERRVVIATERKMMKMEQRARNEMRWKVEKKGNEQTHFKPDVPGPANG